MPPKNKKSHINIPDKENTDPQLSCLKFCRLNIKILSHFLNIVEFRLKQFCCNQFMWKENYIKDNQEFSLKLLYGCFVSSTKNVRI